MLENLSFGDAAAVIIGHGDAWARAGAGSDWRISQHLKWLPAVQANTEMGPWPLLRCVVRNGRHWRGVTVTVYPGGDDRMTRWAVQTLMTTQAASAEESSDHLIRMCKDLPVLGGTGRRSPYHGSEAPPATSE